MQTKETIRTIEPPRPPGRRAWIPALAAAAVVAIAVAAGATWLTAGDDEPAPAVTDPPPTTQADLTPDATARADAAVARIESFYDALAAGDLAAIEALLSPDARIEEAQRRVWEFGVVMESAYPAQLEGCGATSLDNTLFVAVECTAVDTSPVAAVLGGGTKTEPWQAFDDGPLQWLPSESETLGSGTARLVGAYAEYLAAARPDEYEAACAVTAYKPLTVVVNEGIALAAPCAELLVDAAPGVAAWLEAGRPDPAALGDEARVEAAIGRVEAVMAAIAAGDVEAIGLLVANDGEVVEADRHMWAFNAVEFASYPIEIAGCTEVPTTPGDDVVRVSCRVVSSNPVAAAVELGATEWPFLVYDDGGIEWRPSEPALTPLARAYSDYLLAFDRDAYEAACNPATYITAGERINFDGNIALTAACAETIVPLTEDVAEWVLAGRPEE